MLSTDVLAEAVREGEIRVQAQLQQAMASDSRAMTWLSVITGILATSTAGIGALYFSKNQTGFVVILCLFAVTQFFAGIKAVDAVRPKKFCFPGNEPKNWRPDEWEVGATHDLHQAKFEQCKILQSQIKENADWAKRSNDCLRLSMDISLWSLLMLSIVSTVYYLFQAARP